MVAVGVPGWIFGILLFLAIWAEAATKDPREAASEAVEDLVVALVVASAEVASAEVAPQEVGNIQQLYKQPHAYYSISMEIPPVKKQIFPLLLLSLVLSCDEDTIDCSTVLCAGPPNLVFELLLNGENVLDANLFSEEDIAIGGTFPDSFELNVNETNFKNSRTRLLFIDRIAWEVSTYDFNLNIGSEYSHNLRVEIQLSTGSCCGGIPRISSYQVDGISQENPNQVQTLNLE